MLWQRSWIPKKVAHVSWRISPFLREKNHYDIIRTGTNFTTIEVQLKITLLNGHTRNLSNAAPSTGIFFLWFDLSVDCERLFLVYYTRVSKILDQVRADWFLQKEKRWKGQCSCGNNQLIWSLLNTWQLRRRQTGSMSASSIIKKWKN